LAMPTATEIQRLEPDAPEPKEIGRVALDEEVSELGDSNQEAVAWSTSPQTGTRLVESCRSFHEASQPPECEKPQLTHTRVALLVCGHALSASLLLVINKWAQKVFPFVWTLTTLQFSFASSLVFLLGKIGVLEVEHLELKKVFQFFPAAGMFFITITAGNAVVGRTNVDTFIVMRSLVPIPAAILETLLLKEPWPRPKSLVGLAIIVIGAVVYAHANFVLVRSSAAWAVLFLVLGPVDAVLIKHIVNASGLSPWSLVLYNNVCAVLPGIFFSLLLEFRVPENREAILGALTGSQALMPLALSCLTGVSISYFQLNVRGVISSTAFMVLGVSNKFISVGLSQLAHLDANGDVRSLGCTLLSILGAILFQQTVKGKGISQAPSTDFHGRGALSCAFVALGVGAAAGISLLQRGAG